MSELNENQRRVLELLAKAGDVGVPTTTRNGRAEASGPTMASLVKRGLAKYKPNRHPQHSTWYRGREAVITQAGRDLIEGPKREEAIAELFGECLHTAYRKGIDCDQAMPIHRLISEMPPGEWGHYIDWVLWALRESGVKIELS